jgi:hypothetical protein
MDRRRQHVVVEVQRVRRGAVGERRSVGAGARPGSEHGARSRGVRRYHLLHDPRGRFGCARQHHADCVEDGARRDRARRRRWGRVDDEAGKIQHSAFPMAAMKRRLMPT